MSHILWTGESPEGLRTNVVADQGTMAFVERSMAPSLVFDHELTANMRHAKLEIIYQAGQASRWQKARFASPKVRFGLPLRFTASFAGCHPEIWLDIWVRCPNYSQTAMLQNLSSADHLPGWSTQLLTALSARWQRHKTC